MDRGARATRTATRGGRREAREGCGATRGQRGDRGEETTCRPHTRVFPHGPRRFEGGNERKIRFTNLGARGTFGRSQRSSAAHKRPRALPHEPPRERGAFARREGVRRALRGGERQGHPPMQARRVPPPSRAPLAIAPRVATRHPSSRLPRGSHLLDHVRLHPPRRTASHSSPPRDALTPRPSLPLPPSSPVRTSSPPPGP